MGPVFCVTGYSYFKCQLTLALVNKVLPKTTETPLFLHQSCLFAYNIFTFFKTRTYGSK